MMTAMDGEFKLETIFDVCDEDHNGYITIDRFKTLAREHFGTDDTEDIDNLLHILDPENKGKIGFTEFCRGVQSILELPSQVQRKASFGDSLNDVRPLLSLSAVLPENTEINPLESSHEFSYQEYTTDEDGSALIVDDSNEGDGKTFLHPNLSNLADDASVKSSENSRTEFTDEESYEDYGQVEDCETDMSDQYMLAHTKLKNRKRSSAAHARRIQKSPSPQTLDDIDGEFQKLTQKIQYLESHLHQLTEERTSTESFQKKIKDENNILVSSVVERVHYLEEQVRESEDKHNLDLRKYTEEMHRQERNKTTQIDYLNERLQVMEGDYNDAKSELPRLKSEVYKLKMEKMELQERLNGVQQDYDTLQIEHDEALRKQQCERKNTDLLLDELGKELEELRRYKIQHCPVKRYSDADIRAEVSRLKEEIEGEENIPAEENKNLHENNIQMLNQCYEEGRNLVEDGHAKSLASELQTLTKEELVNALKNQEEINQQLRLYIDKMILSILEKNPSILEVH